MSNILFVTTRNVLNTSGELRLIKNRTKALFTNWNIVTEFIVINSKKRIEASNEKIGYGSSMQTIGVNKYNLFSIIVAFLKSKKLIQNTISKKNFSCVILSGSGTLHFFKFIKKCNKNTIVLADFHGSIQEFREYSNGTFFQKIFKRVLYYQAYFSEKKYLKLLDGILVPSKSLARDLKQTYQISNLKYHVVPCALENDYIENDLIEKYRKKYRSLYRIESNEILFIYSGGASHWQCIEKTITIFNNIRIHLNKNAKLLVLSFEIEKIKKIVGYNEHVIFDSLSSADATKALFAGDFAFLIRENYVTNNVAFPNKFLEYVQSGMNIITTPYIHDIAEILEYHQIGIIINPYTVDYRDLLDFINNHSTVNWSDRKSIIMNASFNSTLQHFIHDYKLL